MIIVTRVRALYGRRKFTVRRHTFNKDSLPGAGVLRGAVPGHALHPGRGDHLDLGVGVLIFYPFTLEPRVE